ncbi:putative fimbrial protein SthD [Buttiauxella agrestis]|uniref:Putative fimbrial protein SthD n=1 Tax=Buttiauxella agrestis TaxID=82977 RepID=A0A381C7A0_9ENTR|nr:fimbrial protein [Buttiauxella agrestis]SUW63746.1 putative fimbrial protein SthD [Buttiauxella agrestis]
MKKTITALIFSGAALCYTGIASAADPVNISVTGRVLASPCVVDTDTVSKQVDLGQAIANNLNQPGGNPIWKDFQLLLTQCPATTQSATATFTGVVDSTDPTAFKNQGTAGNSALQMTNTDHSVIYGNASQMTVAIDNSTRQAIFPLSARIFSPSENATGGTFNAALSVVFTYQ